MESLRESIELISDELCKTIGGDFDLRLAPGVTDRSVEKLCMRINVMLETSRRTLASFQDRNAQLAELDRLKSDFLANVSHKLRTPLTLILAPLGSLLAGGYGEPSDTQRFVLERIQRNAARLNAHVNDLLDFARLEAGKATPRRERLDAAEIASALADEAREAAKARGITLRYAPPATAAPLLADRRMLEKVLLNLLSNALKFTPAGGSVTFEVGLHDGRVLLAVSDSGEGIPAEQLPKLFQRFHQIDGRSSRRYDGTGLGLALAKEFTEQLGGSIEVQSEAGKGSRFTVSLPAALAEAGALPHDAAAARAPRRSLPALVAEASAPLAPAPTPAAGDAARPRVLVVEDNADLRAYVAELLCEQFHVTTACDGHDALAALEEGGFDIVVSDVMMPGMDGYELTRRLKASPSLRYIPVLLLTARSGSAETVRGLACGADDFLTKPFDANELRGRLAAALRTRELYRELEAANARLETKVAERTQDLAQANALLRTTNRELETASRMKDEFLATLSHELRTPLNGILGWSELLRGGDFDDETVASGLATIERSARTQKRLIDELLDVSRIITGKLQLESEAVDLAALVESVIDSVRLTAGAKAQSLTTAIAAVPMTVQGDSDRLRQVVWNLMTNAIKFTPSGGEIRVTLEPAGERLELSVTDTGQGIDAEFLPHVFDRFRQEDASTKRQHGGLGLGLSIVRHLVELHGGSAEARSAGRGAGAAFVVRLPYRSALRAVDPAKAPSKPRQLDGLRVLLVDDAPDVRDLVTLILKKHGAAVTAVGSVQDAVASFAEATPDVVLSDIGMPGEDGFDMIARLRAAEAASGRRVPAAALTAYAKQEDCQRMLDAGFLAHLAKPIEPDRLIAAIAKLCGRID